MADLNSIELIKLEKFLEMGSGYVLDFSNRTFQEFILERTGKDIYSDKYELHSGSKANRLRAFWKKESSYAVGKLIEDLVEYWLAKVHIGERSVYREDEILHQECIKIAERLKRGGPVENIDSLKANSNDKSFTALEKSIKNSIDRNEPEIAIDRLHTFVTKYVRDLCDKYSIEYDKNTPLHSLFGGYVKHLTNENKIESKMTVRILKSSISVFEAFNDVRNNQSLAHDNTILNYSESILIFNDIANVIHFINTLEGNSKEVSTENEDSNWDELPF